MYENDGDLSKGDSNKMMGLSLWETLSTKINHGCI